MAFIPLWLFSAAAMYFGNRHDILWLRALAVVAFLLGAALLVAWAVTV